MDFTSAFTISVTASVLASVIVLFSHFMWRRVIVPCLRHIMYDGVNLAGRWKLVDQALEDGEEDPYWFFAETLELRQYANELTGTAVMMPHGQHKRRSFKIKGGIRDGFVVISMRPRNKKTIGFSLVLGRVTANGCEIKGKCTMWDTDESEIVCHDLKYSRITEEEEGSDEEE